MQDELHEALSELTGKLLLVGLGPDGKPLRLASEDEVTALRARASPDNIDFAATIDALTEPTTILRRCYTMAAGLGLTLRLEFEPAMPSAVPVTEILITGSLGDDVSIPDGRLGIWRVKDIQSGPLTPRTTP